MLLKSFAGGRTILPLAFVMGLTLATQPLSALESVHTVSPAVEKGTDLGPVDPAEEFTVTVQLQLHNRAAFDEAVSKLYDSESATYHQWMTDEDIQKYAPSAAELKTVQQELAKHGLAVISSDRFSVRAHGTAAQMAEAFQTQFHHLFLNRKTFRAHIQDARLTGAAGSLVDSIVGLDQHTVKPLVKRAADPRTGLARSPIKLSKVLQSGGGLGAYITDKCLQAPAEQTYLTPGASLPVGVYFGNVYNPVNGLFCDFTPAQLQAHYGLTAAYKAGLDGTGQTIVLLEAYGYPTMESDANAFFQLAGLPPLTSANFEVIYPDGTPNPQAGILSGWNVEIALDIQYAHSMAPKAKILVVASNGQDNEDFQYAMRFIVSQKLGTVVSDSWEEDNDLLAGPQEQNSYTNVLEVAAAKGVSFQFSSGDGGDDGFGSPIGSAEVPANNPWATAVGGTAILNNNTGSGFWEIGWGDDFALIASGGVLDLPGPEPLYFFGGAGGGESVYFKKPAWQSKIPGSGRQVPDISALADPYTGVPLVVTLEIDGAPQQVLYIGVGGTSLASPIVTGILAIATQKAGKPLGQAAPLIASLPAGAVTDILPLSSPTNLAGTIFDQNGASFYPSSYLFGPFIYPAQEGFISASYPFDALDAEAIAFSIDSSLAVTTGWDNVTGFGVPNGLTFIDAIGK